jgi:hypothetical protein
MINIINFIENTHSKEVYSFLNEYFINHYGCDEIRISGFNGCDSVCEIWLDLVYFNKTKLGKIFKGKETIKQGRYVMTSQTVNKILTKITEEKVSNILK